MAEVQSGGDILTNTACNNIALLNRFISRPSFTIQTTNHTHGKAAIAAARAMAAARWNHRCSSRITGAAAASRSSDRGHMWAIMMIIRHLYARNGIIPWHNSCNRIAIDCCCVPPQCVSCHCRAASKHMHAHRQQNTICIRHYMPL